MTQVVIRVPTAQELSQRVDETIEQKEASGERLVLEKYYGDGSMFVAELTFRRDE